MNTFLLCKSKEEKRTFFPRISFEDFEEIHRIWNQTKNLEVEVVKHSFVPEKLSYKNLQTLSGSTWLNDEVKFLIHLKQFYFYLFVCLF